MGAENRRPDDEQEATQFFAAFKAKVALAAARGDKTVAELVAQYVEFATEHFRRNSDEKYRIKAAITPLFELFGDLAPRQ